MSRKIVSYLLFTLFLSILLISAGFAMENMKVYRADEGCSSFCLSMDRTDACIYGTNFDWAVNPITPGQLFVNKRNVIKTGWEAGIDGVPAKWTSKYGSLTFNVAGYQMPWAGMNEAGLIISTMQLLLDTKIPAPDKRSPLDSPFWLQYQLDNCATVQEVLESDSRVRLSKGVNHYLVCDKKGNCAVIEFLDGKMVYYTGKTLPVKVLTNSTYVESMNAWKKHDLSLLYDSLLRFTVAADQVKKYTPSDNRAAVFYAFYVLSLVSRSITNWSIAFDNKDLQVYFTSKLNPEIRRIDFTKLDFSSKTPVQMLDVHAPLAGDISDKLSQYSHQACLDHIYEASLLFGTGLSKDQVSSFLEYLESFPYAKE